jgi:hypothetical protein
MPSPEPNAVTQIDPSTFTDLGRKDYVRNCVEIESQRNLQKSPYSDVFRLHCTDGYVEFIGTRSVPDAATIVARHFGILSSDVDGYQSNKIKAELLTWLKGQGITIYDCY